MAKAGIKVKELARELGVTSRVVVDRCRVEGLSVQNSITRLPPEVARRVRAWLSGDAPVDRGGFPEPSKRGTMSPKACA